MRAKTILQNLSEGKKVNLTNNYEGIASLERTLQHGEQIKPTDLVRIGSMFDDDSEVQFITYAECKKRGITINLIFSE